METTELTAGRELDALIAEAVMGLRRTVDTGRYVGTRTKIPPAYSTDTATAWKVVEHFQAQGFGFALEFEPSGDEPWMAVFAPSGDAANPEGAEMVWADTAPLAICLAALAAVESEGA